MILSLLISTAAAGGVPRSILMLDREMGGLVDSYLEAVPECPVRGDTPVRLWLLDLSSIRVRGALRPALLSAGDADDPVLRGALKRYLLCCETCLEAFDDVRAALRSEAVPDSVSCISMEEALIEADSAWLEAGSALFGRLAEEGWR